MKKYFFVFVLAVSFFSGSNAQAGEQGHYVPGVFAIRDYAQPPPGFYASAYNIYYQANGYVNADGDDLDSASLSGSITRPINIRGRSLDVTFTGTANVDIDLEMTVQGHQLYFAWIPDIEPIMGFNYGAILAPYFGYMKVKAEAEADVAGTLSVGPLSQPVTANVGAKVRDSKYGIGDTFVAPLWLGKHGKRYDMSMGYGFYAPTGHYDEGDLANIGMGFWTHQLQWAGLYYLQDIQATALFFAATYEWHSKKYDKDVRPGQNVTLEYGIHQYLHERFAIGISGSSQFQISDDTGEQAPSVGGQDVNHMIGGEIQFWPVKGKMLLTARTSVEYGGEDRFQGILSSFNVTWIFGSPIEEKMEKAGWV